MITMWKVGLVRCRLGLWRGLRRLWLGTLGHTAAKRQGWRGVVDNGASEWGSPGLEAGLACPRRPEGG